MQAVLTIDLAAVVANWRALGARHGAPVAGVVKADGYGLGASPVAQALAAAGCRDFFVAHPSEGLALRAALGPGPMIAVLDGFAPGEDGDAALTPVLNHLGDVADHRTRPPAGGAILHLDTGMRRLGLDQAEQARAMADPTLLGDLPLRYVMTHLACADEPAHPLNALQAERFAAAALRIAPGIPRSLANSSGLFLGPGFASDLGRPGCALYGINPTPGQPNPMAPVVRLDAPVLQVREIAAAETVGYGATWRAARPSRIATVAAGYADGYLRALSGRSVAHHAGRALPLVGRVSMDLLTFDATDAPEVGPGSLLTLIGPGCTPDDLAGLAGTIGYEILTALGPRHLRAYRPA